MLAAPAVSRAFALLLACACASASAQTPQKAYQPTVGQPGKDVVWVPSPDLLVERMLDLAQVTARDFVIDLGSGDGRTVIAAAKRGARALGVEYNPDLVVLSRRRAEAAGVAGRTQFVKADLFKTDFSKATVITMFLLPELNLKLRPKLLGLKPGTRIVSNAYDLGDWEPDEVARLGNETGCDGWCKALLWIVPANFAGTYQVPHGTLELKQEFQRLYGTYTRDGRYNSVHGRVRGREFTFLAGGRQYRGRMRAGKLELR
jgi:SAM-dependent methyltransferase